MEEIQLLHFNDVYHISQVELVSRLGRVLTKPKQGVPEHEAPLTIFGGDAFSPSLEATLARGAYMAPVLNDFQVDVACYGNHDFDFGEKRLDELTQMTNFPWLLTNALKASSTNLDAIPNPEDLLSHAQSFFIRERKGYRIGFFGLAGTDWPLKCQHLPASSFQDPARYARMCAKHLRTVEHCDFVVAITHMRMGEDLAVSNATQDHDEHHVDLLLAGHDHEVVCRFRGDTESDAMVIRQGLNNADLIEDGLIKEIEGDIRIVKSGSDFHSYSVCKLMVGRRPDGAAFLDTIKLTQMVDLEEQPAYETIEPLPMLKKYLNDVQRHVGNFCQTPVFHTEVPLEGRSTYIRSEETNLGNMIADAVNSFHKTQICFINAGTIRCDALKGPRLRRGSKMSLSDEPTTDEDILRVKDVIDMTPFQDYFVVKRIKGSGILKTLENAVCDAGHDGRFLQCSGLRYTYDKRLPEGARVVEAYHVPLKTAASSKEERINPDQYYTITVSSFLARGFDGYDCIRAAKPIEQSAAVKKITQVSLMLLLFCGANAAKGVEHAAIAEEDEEAGEDDDGYDSGFESQSEDDDDDACSSADSEDSGFESEREMEQFECANIPEAVIPPAIKERIQTARRNIIIGRHAGDGLPVIRPLAEGRIFPLYESNSRKPSFAY